jgi:hypothetical protein
MHGRLTVGLALLRATGLGALLLLVWNPTSTRRLPASEPPLVLLDASLSMGARGGRWQEARDSARAIARGGVIWRFGAGVAAFDTVPPSDGASRLQSALDAAAARGGPVVVVTDGEIADAGRIAPDLERRPRIVVLPRAPFRDAFVAALEGPHRIGPEDTLRLKVSYGTTGERGGAWGKGKATLAVLSEGRRLTSREVPLPDSGIVSTDLALPASRFPHSGWSVLEVRLDGVADSEPRDDARLFVLEITTTPAIVVLAAPPDWDLRFLARTLSDVARAPLRMFVQTDPGAGGRWLDAVTLAPVSPVDVRAAVARAHLIVEGGDPAGFGRFPASGALLRWSTHGGQEGDWYFQQPPVSPLAPTLGGIAWDSLPPAIAIAPLAYDSMVPVLTVRRARRGLARPAVALLDGGPARRVDVAVAGLYRWVFRGGPSAEAYRALVAALTDWLLGGGNAREIRAVPEVLTVANGLPLPWRWTGAGPPRDLVVALAAPKGERRDTLRFDASGRGELWLPPDAYRYTLVGGPEHGLVAVERYSDEWRPASSTVRPQAGDRAGQVATVRARDRWWLFALALAAFAAEWAWRRRLGLP